MLSTKNRLIIAAALLIICAIIFASVMINLNWDFSELSTSKYETNTKTISKTPKNISINTNTADIQFVLAEKPKVVCYEKENLKHNITLDGDTLSINLIDERKWYDYIGINFSNPSITLFLPEGEYGTLIINSDTSDTNVPSNFKFKSIDITESTGDVTLLASADEAIKIKTSTGDISLQGLSAHSLSLQVSTGKIAATDLNIEKDILLDVSTGDAILKNIQCGSLTSHGDTGHILLTNVIAANQFKIERSTGDIKFEACDADEISVKTDTGNTTGSLLTEKIIFATSDTGLIDIPKSATGGKCEITTDTGNIKITIKQLKPTIEDYGRFIFLLSNSSIFVEYTYCISLLL